MAGQRVGLRRKKALALSDGTDGGAGPKPARKYRQSLKLEHMGEDNSIAQLRSRVTELVEEEGILLSEAFAASKGGGDRRGVDALFARVQALQVERCRLQKEIGNLLGTRRMHVASEIWRTGTYEYRPEDGTPAIRIEVTQGALGFQAMLPGRSAPVRIETLRGAFDGPIASG